MITTEKVYEVLSAPFSGDGDEALWAEFLALEWDRNEVEVIGGPYGDCLVAACDQSGVSPSVHPTQVWSVLSIYSSGPADEWATRIGHGATVMRRGVETFIFVPYPYPYEASAR